MLRSCPSAETFDQNVRPNVVITISGRKSWSLPAAARYDQGYGQKAQTYLSAEGSDHTFWARPEGGGVGLHIQHFKNTNILNTNNDFNT